MSTAYQGKVNSLLGYPPDARLLIINADDFGFCNAINEAIIRALEHGLVRSTSLMVPCPWARHAMRYLRDHPEIPFGVHLTIISDPQDYRWGPVAPTEQVPSLVDPAGFFYNFDDRHAALDQIQLEDVEVEFRAQIETVLRAGLRPTHLDWHALRFGGRTDLPDLMARLAKEYGLAQRVIGRDWIERVQAQGLPTIDHDFLDSYNLEPSSKARRYTQLLRALPSGLSEWAVHPGFNNLELRAMEPTGASYRQADYDFWTSPLPAQIIQEEGIILLDYRPLQAVWKGQ